MAKDPAFDHQGPLDSELLTVFCRVAETRNFSRAALHLRMAQPVVTRKIRRLEEHLGLELFVRSNRGCELTAAGELLASKAAGILLQLSQLQEEVKDAAGKVSGTVALGITAAAGMLLTPFLMPKVAALWPNLRVELVEAVSQTLVKRVASRELSMALVYDPPPDSDLIAWPLLMEKLYLIGRPTPVLAAMKQATVKQLAALPLVLPSKSQTVRVLLEDAFAEEDMALSPAYEANSSPLLRAMVSQGLGYTVLTQGSVSAELESGVLRAVPLAARGMSLALTLVTSKDHAKLYTVQLMADLIKSEVRQRAQAGSWPGAPRIMQG